MCPAGDQPVVLRREWNSAIAQTRLAAGMTPDDRQSGRLRIRRPHRRWWLGGLGLGVMASLHAEPAQYLLFNVSRGGQSKAFEQVSRLYPAMDHARVRVGLATIFSYLHHPRERTIGELQQFLEQARKHDMPVVIQLDGENWWGARPDLWNWWDAARPGWSPTNRANVEWAGWSPDDALKIAWRNWGRQLRVLPPPNLMSPAYRAACHAEMRVLIPLILDWWRALPEPQRHLWVGLRLGWESSIGVNAWYYPNGNDLLGRPPEEDPKSGLKAQELPARGVSQIGYAAVSTAGLRHAGEITEADLAEVVRRHLEDLCRLAAELGVPRDKLFTHAGGWKENELLYQAAVNAYSCPGWSFYDHAADPGRDSGVQAALARTDAPYWAAVEWLYQGPRETAAWRAAFRATLTARRCRYLCIYNWDDVRNRDEVLMAVKEAMHTWNEP